MGYYYQFKSKEIQLKKDTPKEIVGFLDAFINENNFDYPKPNHALFTLERWSSVLGKWAWYDKPFTFFNKDKLILFIWCDVNYERDVIIEFDNSPNKFMSFTYINNVEWLGATPIKSNDVGDVERADEYYGKEFGNPFEQIVYWATHSGWRYCQGQTGYRWAKEQCGNDPIIRLSHFNSMVNLIIKNPNNEWQSKQQPLNNITLEKFITMVKNSSPEIKQLIKDEIEQL